MGSGPMMILILVRSSLKLKRDNFHHIIIIPLTITTAILSKKERKEKRKTTAILSKKGKRQQFYILKKKKNRKRENDSVILPTSLYTLSPASIASTSKLRKLKEEPSVSCFPQSQHSTPRHAWYLLHLKTRRHAHLVATTRNNKQNSIVLWAFNFHAPFLCNNGGISPIPSWTKPLFLEKPTVLKTLGIVLIWVIVENGSWACWVAESGLDCWDFAYIDCLCAVL